MAAVVVRNRVYVQGNCSLKILSVVVLFCFASIAFADTNLKFQIHKVSALYNFVETVSGVDHRSRSIKELFEKSKFNNEETKALIEEFNSAAKEMDRGVHFKDFPESRRMGQSTSAFFILQSAYAKDLKDFSSRTVSWLPLSDHTRLFKVIAKFEPIYDELIWNKTQPLLIKWKRKLEALTAKSDANKLLANIAKFYGSQWPEGLDFTLSLIPDPSKKGGTSSESIGPVEMIGFMDNDDFEGMFGVVIHELCHSLYEAQPGTLQSELEKSFLTINSKHAQFTYQTLNEALATTIGNGWAYERATGKLDTTSWYNDPYYDKFAKALLPLLKEYIQAGKTIDEEFVKRSVALYEQLFPTAHLEFDNILKKTHIASNESKIDGMAALRAFFKEFNLSGSRTSTPLNNKDTFESLKDYSMTNVLIFTPEDTKNLKAALDHLPQLQPFSKTITRTEENFVFSHSDEKGHATVVIKVRNLDDLARAVKAMKEWKLIDPNQSIRTY
jgi:hypothetical protein